MDQVGQDAEGEPRPDARLRWERPALTLLGRVKDLVRGFGKTGPNADSDPQSTRKTGVG
jgi:hypothetical protein